MTDQRPESGDNTTSNENEAAPPESEEVETAAEQPEEAVPAEADSEAPMDAESADEVDPEEGETSQAEDDAAVDEAEVAADVVAETEAEAADAAAAGAAWTTTPVAPDPEATEAALAALAAKPEVTLESPESPPPPPPGEPEDEGTPVLLVGGILVGAFIVALAIVLILFRPFDSLTDTDASLSPSPVVTEEPSESPATAFVDAPDFVEMPLEEAEATATDYGLVVRVNPVETDEVGAGIVLDQDPAAGEPVEEGSTVELSVARAVPTASVPDLSGLDEAGAESALEEAGFVVGNITIVPDRDVPEGQVISTDPETDTELPVGTEVDLVISSGPEIINVPDVTGLDEEDSTRALEDAGFVVGEIIEEASDEVPVGDVIRTDPQTDAEIPLGSEIDLIISTGPATVAVPDIVDVTEAEALDRLDTAGLVPGEATEATDETIVEGNVISSDPVADTEVAPGAEVAYVISTGPATVAVPDIVDVTEAEALDRLDTAGLVPGEATEATDETIVEGNVISSDPVADTEVAPGAEVAYVISTGPATVAVPDIVDVTEAEALDRLDTAGLVPGEATEAFSDTVAAGNLISQSPAADTEVELGSAIDYTISLGVETAAVPDLSGPAAEADAKITAAGFAVGVTFEVNSDSIPAGEVNDQNPVAGEPAPLGSEIDYTISIGPEQVEVPDVVGMTEADALDAIDGAGLAPGTRAEAFSDTVAAGNLISQSPAAGAMADIGSAMDYTISLGPATVAVPDIVDVTEAEALDRLDTAGLVPGEATEAFSDTVAAGNLISQSPAADTEVELGSAIDYTISLGVETAAVPDLSGPAAEADAKITAAGFAVGVTFEVNSDSIPAGEVNDQNPVAGEPAPLGSEIDYTISIGPEQVEVPDVVGMTEADALDAIDGAGLAPGTRAEAFSDTVAAGNLISQSPAAGAMADIGSAMDYTISLGVETVAVPDIVDVTEAEALDRLDTAGLVPGEATEAFSDTVAAGNLISQSPAADTEVELGSAIDYTISLGVETAAVPDLSGPAAEADAKITAAGFAVGVTFEVNSDSIPAGEVNDQNPVAGEPAPLGSEIDYTISIGPEQVEVPDVVGMTEADALDAIDGAGLAPGTRAEAFSDTVAAGNLISQSPAAGAMADIGSAMDYTISLGVETVAVPDIVDVTEAEALDRLDTAGLVPGEATEAFSDTVAAGNLISQSPAADTEVELGSAIDYTISLGVETAAVPDLSGPAAEADAKITAAGFAVGVTFEVNSDSIPAGEVNDQNPVAGEPAPLGSEIDYTISIGPEQVEVPDVVGMTEADALDAIDGAGLAPGTRSEAFSDTVAAGNLISSDPVADTEVAPGAEVAYVISTGPATVAVPDIVDVTEAEALDRLDTAGLVPGEATEAFSDTVAAGNLISQSPAADTEVELGSAIDYTISLGVETAAVPDLSGPAAEADAKITAAGFAVGVTFEVNSDSIPAGEVNDQNPVAGEPAPLGSEIDYTISIGPEQVEVPDVVGMTEADALDAIDGAGLAPGTRAEAFSDTVAAGNLISQSPAAGAMADIGSAMDYTISLGVETVAVPDIVDVTEAEALDRLDTAGLVPGEATEAFSDTVAAGNLISQSPAADTEVELGSAIDYTISLGVEQVEVPAVRGLSQEDASAAIEEADLTVGEVEERNHANVPAGAALRTSPAAGEMVDIGSSVSLFMSIGPEQVEVPDVVGMTEADALDAIDGAGLAPGTRAEAFSDTVAAGNLISQSPAAGAMADIGSAMDYTISLGVETVAVPDIVDVTEAEALDRLDTAGLVPGEATEAFSDTVAAGNLISQSPAADTEVELGSAVDYTISIGPEQVEVPAVRGLSQEDASAAIEEADLTVGEVEERNHANVPAGAALRTSPAAGEMVDIGSSVSLFMSIGPEQVEVPDVVGMTEADALDAIDGAGLAPGTRSEAFSDTVAAGNLISTSPAAGTTVDADSAVDYVLSLGVEQVTVPDVIDVAEADANAAIEAAGLNSGEITSAFDEDIVVGNVASQDPTSGMEVDKGSTVDLVISDGPTPFVTVPATRDLSEADAIAAIEGANLVVGETTYRTHEKVAEGAAIRTDPAEGEEIRHGEAVQLFISMGSQFRTIPDVSGQEDTAAQAALEAEDLTVLTDERNNGSVPSGVAVRTEPAAGQEVSAGDEVTLVVSTGPKQVDIPDVVGLTRADARTAITDAELKVGDETVVEDNEPQNTVIAQDPVSGGQADKNSTVNLTVSSGPPQVVIPPVRDIAATDAQAGLEERGLVVETKEVFNAKVAAGNAIKTTPPDGTPVDIGASVKMNVSKGPKPVAVPDVVGQKKGAATTAITDAGLTVGEQSSMEDTTAKNTVIEQDPAAGTEVAAGSAVNLTVSSGPPSETIPEVRDVPADEARATLESLGFEVETKEVFNAKVAAGNAIKTNPAAGESVGVPSTVTMNVSKGPKPVAVPDVVGQKKGAATTAITDAGLTVGEQSSMEDTTAKNTVIEQDPAAGTEVAAGSAVNLTVSSGPPMVEIPEVRNQSQARAVNDLESLGLIVETKEVFNANVAAGDAIKSNPAAGEMAQVGSDITVNISKGVKPVTVPNLVGLGEGEIEATLTDAELKPGSRSETENESAPGTVVGQTPAEGATVDKNSTVDYTVSTGPAVEPMGSGGDLESSEVTSQLDLIASEIEPIRELELSNTPYDGSNSRQHELALAERIGILRDRDAIKAEERALKRLGLLSDGDDLATLLETLYGQDLPVAYFEDDGHLSVLEDIGMLNAAQRAEAARELDRALVDQRFGLDSTRIGDKSVGDKALAVYALEQGDATAAMIDWSAANGKNNKTNQVIVPGDDAIYESMPLILQREYSLPFLEGRIFADRLLQNGGWGAVNDAWGRPPESTEQILHPKLYPNERPTTVVMDGIAGRFGNGWSEGWQQTMGELRLGVWLANDTAGTQANPKAAIKLPKANAAAGWGGDRLVSLGGPDGQWAIVWQTKWDTEKDVDQFTKAADDVIAGLDGAGLVARADVSSGVSNPVLVLIASSDDTLASVAEALGVVDSTQE